MVLLGIAGYVWSTSGGTEVDKSFESMKQTYVCPHCGGTFELTGAETTASIEAHGGIICSLCNKNIDDFISAKAKPELLGGSVGDEQLGDDEPDDDEPPAPAGGRRKRNR